ncbi:MAG: hypothetical protein ACHQ2Z_07125 [Elusimicrobiota bacterium]
MTPRLFRLAAATSLALSAPAFAADIAAREGLIPAPIPNIAHVAELTAVPLTIPALTAPALSIPTLAAPALAAGRAAPIFSAASAPAPEAAVSAEAAAPAVRAKASAGDDSSGPEGRRQRGLAGRIEEALAKGWFETGAAYDAERKTGPATGAVKESPATTRAIKLEKSSPRDGIALLEEAAKAKQAIYYMSPDGYPVPIKGDIKAFVESGRVTIIRRSRSGRVRPISPCRRMMRGSRPTPPNSTRCPWRP